MNMETMSSEDNVYGVMTYKGYVTCTICNGNKKYLLMVQKCRNNVATIQNNVTTNCFWAENCCCKSFHVPSPSKFETF